MKTARPQTSFPKWTLPGKSSPPAFKHLVGGALLLAGLSIGLAFLLAGYSGPRVPDYSAGDIARADVIAPADLVFKDEEATEAARAAAQDEVLPVYRYAPSRSTERAAQLAEMFQQCRSLLASAPDTTRRAARFSQLPAALQTEILARVSSVMVKPVSGEGMDYLLVEGFQTPVEQLLGNALKQTATFLIVEDEKTLLAGKTQFSAVESAGRQSTRSFDQVLTRQQVIERLEAWMRSNPDTARRSRFIAENVLGALLEPGRGRV